jgi:outer membrane receptor protein involved in Fe transport
MSRKNTGLGGGRVLLVLAVLGGALATAPPASTQAVYGSIAGTVVDSTGAAIPGATVTITSPARQSVDTAVTNNAGFFSKERLLPGVYEVKAELTGFKASVVSNVRVSVDTQSKVDFTLEVGQMSETVMVEGSSLLKADRADVSTTFDSEQLTELPVLDRNFTKFILLTPGTTELNWQHAASENPQGSTQTMVNGQHFSGTGYQLDGTENRDPILGIIVINPTLESIAESKITSQNYDAEFGQATAGVVSVQTKSGTNTVNGSAFYFGQRDRFQARNPFTQPDVVNPITGKVLPESSKNQFGGSIGGPIQKNKWFFFGDYQGERRTDGGSRLLSVPTALARTGDLSEYGVDIFDPAGGDPVSRQQFAGNVIPAGRLSPQALALMNLIPLPNTTGTINGTRDNYVAQGSETFNADQFDGRIDGRLSERFNVFGRYSYAKFFRDGPTSFGAGGGQELVSLGGVSDVKNHSLALGFDYTLSPTSILDVRFGYFRYKVDVLPFDYGTTTMADAGVPGLNFDSFSSGMSAIFLRGNEADQNWGSGLGVNRCNCPLAQDESQYQLNINFTKLVGNHTFKAGIDVRRAYNLRVPSDTHRSGEITFNADGTRGPSGGGLGLATFLLGDVSSFGRYVSTTTDARERQWRHFYYVQDTWRPSSKLTLNLGLRLTIINPETVNAPGNGGWLDQSTGEILVGGVGDVSLAGNVKNSLNWEPRLGVTYQINEKTVIRAGYGRSHDIGVFGSTFGHAVTQNLPVLSIQQLNAPESFLSVFNLADGPPAPVFVDSSTGRFPLPDGVQTFVRPFKQTLPRLDAWNVTLQRQLSNDVSAEIGYVGNHGSNTFAGDGPDYNNNQATIVGYPDVPLNERKPFYAPFGWTQNFRAFLAFATNDYNALQAKITKRFSNGWSLLAHYTFAKAYQAEGTYYNIDPNLQWGPPGWHRQHVFEVALTYELPFARDNSWLGGWQVNVGGVLESGYPFDVSYRDSGADRDTGPNRPDLVGDPAIGSGDGVTSPFFNVTPIGSDGSAFGRPAPGTFGDLTRNVYTGPGFWNVDASLFKRFEFGARALELRLEVQNLFNHVNLDNPDAQIGVPGNDNPNAGYITNTTFGGAFPQRNLQLGVRFLF